MVLRHAVSQDIVGRVVVAEEFGFLNTQLHLADDDSFVVVLIAVVAAGGVVHEQLFAQVAVLAVLQYRCEGGALGREEPLARMTGRRCFFCCRSLGALGKTFELCLVGDEALHLVTIRLRNDIIAELKGQQT